MKATTKHLLPTVFVFTAIAIAYACRMLAKFDIGGPAVNHIRTALYLLLFTLWGVSLDRRIIQRQALHCLRLTAALMLLWLILRTLKYSFVTGLAAGRYIWYLYYLPMLFLPLLCVYIALSMGKSEDYRLSRGTGMLSIIPAALFLLVITNDLHQQVFAFKSGVPGLPVSGTYSYRPLYFICLGWMVVCMAFSLVCLFRKSRIPSGEGKRIMPFVLGCAMLLYGILYLSGIPAVRWWFGDMNVMFCLLYAAIYESCIRCRMIPSNTGYVELFEASTLAACIADRSGRIVLRSRAAGKDMTCPQEGQRIVRPDGMRISSAPISGGYAVWQDNVRQLAELRTRLNANKEEMERNKKKLKDAYLVQKSLHELTEKNRIYNELEAKHSRQTAQMRQMLAQCERSGPAERRSLLKKVLLLGTYIKRSANLYFLSSEYQWLPQQELRLTVDEAVRALTACGTECGVIYRTTEPMRASEVVRLFDLLEIVAETTVDDLHSLFISVSDSAMDLSVECAADLSVIASPEVTVRQEDGLWLIRTGIRGREDA
ncbi:MAG: histidine kinase N-terminal 7TM domain-containing protein [Oscillospiraceae bacterium]|nr:histidine kinase N-terminal 7TM domain-containing protein [Oscillospiraceae bacterium]